ncbi:patatin-like phospholipase family protein [Achromobacter pestifer]|uniref:Patatin-like phospholipase family protein n=2 Tax=Achromobacter TaxID=222 RepID=A0A7D4DY60_9BURK|nr:MULTISPECIES: CBASS cGAMP-activated phospholipase [Achromobacter]MDH2052330.1 CBASS cGAMP-activated phospholipase [Achromobacter marplatensis]QKH35367.1 patatin-like phospholipase family protein [Achromobacter pestifer]
MAWTEDRPFQALALTGGGYRGLFTACALQEIEEHIGEPIGRRFDLSYGTSIGGIIALAVAFEVPMQKVVHAFAQSGERIFPPRNKPTGAFSKGWDIVKHWNHPRYRSQALRDVITSLIPEDATLNDATHAVGIPAVNVTSGRPQVFKTRHKAEWTRDWKYRAVDVALATSAAPTFFELAELDGQLYADGGLYANAPDLLALHEAEHFFGVPSDAVRILSVGTTTNMYSLSFESGRELGIQGWMDDNRLFSVTISSQQQLVDQLMQHKLKDRYFRLDALPSNEQAKDLGLDVATEAARRTLMALGKKAASDILNTKLAPFLRHEPQMTLVRSG